MFYFVPCVLGTRGTEESMALSIGGVAREDARTVSAPPRRDVVEAWSRRMKRELGAPVLQRDPRVIATMLPLMEAFNAYFGSEVRGMERVPGGQVLLVGNHSGGVLTPDTTALLTAWFRSRGDRAPLALLALDALFGVPWFGRFIRHLGLVPASEGNADRALDAGSSLLVYPGGAHEAFRPWRDRNRIDFAGHKGFVKLALRRGLPVVPVVGHGGHETMVVVDRGEWLAEKMGMQRMRVGVCPILVQLPWGLSPAAFPGLPLPAKITLQVCEPLDWTVHGPDTASDPRVLARCYEEITQRMQDTLDALARETPRPLLARFRRHVPS
jgi:1-acyl-sn-glycerol-3-phosphate acyltransferase